jgi:aspartate/glutamate racemase/prolyl-tRNA editing enzyme YbaK/EbsC (Cys-tRNA(Pro) deacylase)
VSDDEQIPPRVRANLEFISEAGIWHLVSSNPEVRSCRDAAEHRWRLGDRGIPLCDELKSSVGRVEGADGRYVVVHCRGHQYIDDDKLAALLGGRFRRLEEEELTRVFDMTYGVVTPFGFAAHSGVRQLFDHTVLELYFPPFTMMTNLGSLTCAVEIEPAQLVTALDNAEVADVVRDGDARVPVQHTIGILTGNSPESGMLLWECMNDHIRRHGDKRFRGDLAFPHVLVESVPGMGLSMELSTRAEEVRPVVLGGIERLCTGGATIVGIACNTTQFFASEISEVCAKHGAKFVSLVDATADRLRREGIEAFDFFGIAAVTDLGGWSAFTQLNDEFDLLRPDERELEKINEVAFSVKQRGVDGRAVNRLRNLVTGASQTDIVVIALTELSAILHRHPKNKGGKQIVDTLQVLAEAMADIYLAERSVIDVPSHRDDEIAVC